MPEIFEQLVQRYPALLGCRPAIEQAYAALVQSFSDGGKLLICGNGGSAVDSDHIVGELMKAFVKPRTVEQEFQDALARMFGEDGAHTGKMLQGCLPTLSLTSQAALLSAIANDTDATMVYAQQVYGYGQKSDVLLAISTSGNSRNIIRAAQVARVKGMVVIGLTGKTGGKLAPLCDVAIRVPSSVTSEIQEWHLPIYHALCMALEEVFFPS
jgi:phosphoheptose isomerase